MEISAQRLIRSLAYAALLALVAGCTFNFEVTSQRTALENQVLGAYKELDDELILASSVRAARSGAAATSESKRRALDAKADQDFNRDDIDELKGRGLLGESTDGTLTTLTAKYATDGATAAERQLATTLATEENRDRAEIWRRIIAANANLAAKDLPAIRKTYAKLQREGASAGQWYQSEAGEWQRR